ncbi:antitoxin [Streptomyces sp. NPDC048304]|uniref:FitA-like ribbon-helix-helix domain-containing protein n=1 Tax=Streptomyces sp. NPDC048304 TaxID=3154820 RepID=UPI0033FB2C10
MTAITIRNVPDHILTSVKVHAAQAGQSLQTYVLELLAHDAEKAAPLAREEGETSGQKFVRRLRGSGTEPTTASMSTDELMELLRGE